MSRSRRKRSAQLFEVAAYRASQCRPSILTGKVVSLPGSLRWKSVTLALPLSSFTLGNEPSGLGIAKLAVLTSVGEFGGVQRRIGAGFVTLALEMHGGLFKRANVCVGSFH